jgi:hypothetical protein
MAMKENSLPKMKLQAKERQYKQVRPDNMVSGLSEARKQVKAEGIGFEISVKRKVMELQSYDQPLKRIWESKREN